MRGVSTRQLARMLNINFQRFAKRCPSGSWNSAAPNKENYIDFLNGKTNGKNKGGERRVALVLTYGKMEIPHWVTVQQVIKSKNKCEVKVRDGDGVGRMNCEKLTKMADDLPWYIQTLARSIIYFVESAPKKIARFSSFGNCGPKKHSFDRNVAKCMIP